MDCAVGSESVICSCLVVCCSQGARSLSGSCPECLLIHGGVHSGDSEDGSVAGAQPSDDAVPVARWVGEERARRHVAAV